MGDLLAFEKGMGEARHHPWTLWCPPGWRLAGGQVPLRDGS